MVTKKNQTTLTPKSMTKPYTEKHLIQEGTNQHYIIREFSEDVNEEELVWHRDKRARKVTSLTANGWKYQLDDCLPHEFKEGIEITIPRMMYHRVIKGHGNLVVRIREV